MSKLIVKEVDSVNLQLVELIETAVSIAESVTKDLKDNDQKISDETIELIYKFQKEFTELNNELDGKVSLQ